MVEQKCKNNVTGRNLGGKRMWITKRSIFKEILELKIIL
jgi:hypothetical protein